MTVTKTFNQAKAMKKTFKSFVVFAAAALTLAGCQKVEMEQSRNEGAYKYSFAIVDDTRAVIGDSNVEWVANDRVGMFVGAYKGYANVDVNTTPKMVVLYSNEAIPAGTMAYAYAPYDPENKEGDPDMVKIVVNDIQSGAQASAMPLAGVPFEVEEEIDPKAQEGNGQIKFMNLGSVINFKIFSTDEEFQNETVQYIQFESDKTLAGIGYIDLTAVDMNDESTLELVMTTEENTVRVNEEMAVAAEKEEATPIKMVILPGTFSGTLTVVTDAATYTKEIPEREFARSHSRTFGLDLVKAEREEGVVEVVKTLPYEEPFTSNQGDFTIENIVLPEGISAVWTWSSSYGCMVSNAYVGGTRYKTESMLVSPWIDLTDVEYAAVSFDNAYKYVSAPASYFSLWIMTDEDGAEWEQLTINNYGTGNFAWGSDEVKISEYAGNKVKVAFKYVSGGTSSDTGSWEIKNFSAHIVKADPELAFGDGTIVVEATVDDEEIEVPELTNPHGLEVYYASSNEDVAMVDENSGEVLLMGVAGTAVITAAFDGDDDFEAGEASYTIKVTDPSVSKVYYTKVTSTSDLAEGQYLIVYEGNSTHDAVAFDGSLSSMDVASNGIVVTIEDSQIEQTAETTAAEFTIAAKDGGFSIKSASGLYIGQTSYANGLKPSADDDFTNDISFDSNGNAVIGITYSGGTVTLRYNYASDQLRFRYYKSGQQSIALYKLN